MKNDMMTYDEQEMKVLIHSLQTETDRHVQEMLAQKIQNVKDERTARLVVDMLHSDDTYIHNLAIEMLIGLNEKALPALKATLSDKDRNIRKFAVDALKHIKGRHSCEIALAALDDQDENVVEAALEVIAEQQYGEAEYKLREILKKTTSIWIINSLFRTFARLDIKDIKVAMEDKIISINASILEKNILMNSFVKALGDIGSYQDIEFILTQYTTDFLIDDKNVVFALSNLIIKNEISVLPEKIAYELVRFFKEHWDFQDSGQVLVSIATFVKLQQDFFLADIKGIYNFSKGEEFFIDNLYELIQKLDSIPISFVQEILAFDEPELKMLGLKLIYTKQICGFNSIVEILCHDKDEEISKLAIRIIAEIESYKNPFLLEGLMEFSEEAEVAAVENQYGNKSHALEFLIRRLEHNNQKVRKAAAQKLILIIDNENIDLIEEIIKRNPEVESLEALELLFRLDSNIGWKHITSKMDCKSEIVRVGLIEMMEYSSESQFYSFMDTMINDSSAVIRKKTIKALSRKIHDKSLQLLIDLYNSESDQINRMEIIANLYRFNSDGVMDILNDASCSSDTLIRIASVKSLSFLNGSRVVSALERMLDDPIEEIREAAKIALNKKGWLNDTVR